jgi:hypothetical protein
VLKFYLEGIVSSFNPFMGKGKDPDPYLPLTMIRIRIQEAQKHADPADPDPQHCLCLTNLDADPIPDPAIFVIDLQDANKKVFFFSLNFSAYSFRYITYRTSFVKDKKVIKKSQNSRNQGFSCYFCLMNEDPDPDPDP